MHLNLQRDSNPFLENYWERSGEFFKNSFLPSVCAIHLNLWKNLHLFPGNYCQKS